MCDNLHLEAFVVVCCNDYGSNDLAPRKAWHMFRGLHLAGLHGVP